MRVVVLGTGMIGSVIVHELGGVASIDEVIAVDAVSASVERCVAGANSSKVTGRTAALDDYDRVAALLSEADIAVSCLPHGLSLLAIKAAIAARCHLIDLVGSKYEEKAELNEQALEAGVLIVPGAGVAPGIANFLAARGIELLDEADEAVMLCGGLPRHPLPPLWYQVVFRLESLLGLCTKPALAVEDGELVKLPPLTRLERLTFPEPVGECEAVVTDAHSTAYTLRAKVKRLYEKTVRYKGHWEKMSVLAELGFLDETPIEVDGTLVSPQRVAIPLLERKMKGGSNEDITVLRVTVTGTRGGKRTKLEWEMVDAYDADRRITSMAKTTGFPAILLAEWMAEDKLDIRGVKAIEDVIIGRHFDPFVQALGNRGIAISFREEIE
ncbi:saccharopine dehydrogenase NADP-binding domain-containing protein [Cohnella ginsengisoli]|uniref:Saccharopine dehydrogenase NADP-binding domain-containing protein n=1 Tax=Cohnella ginsengisoli TaxID=425004 RepID=A0A9X4QPS0_9BACL|nr:saccharopine dehydrogenase C-terminal domain-containing protein [Cohnella ginsengisoli]MDG0793792.1 saccharopine dehydrogenase NADP-binding domain-containing protein [Cohnella ginsengisoli]